MRRRAVALALAGATALVTVAGCGTAAGSAPPAPPLRLYERDTGQATVDLGAPGAGPGDLFVFTGDLLDGGPTGPRVGQADGVCTTTSGDANVPGHIVCRVALGLADGQLETQAAIDSGPFFGGSPAALAITGGTGSHRDVRGDGTVTVADPADPSVAVFELRPTP